MADRADSLTQPVVATRVFRRGRGRPLVATVHLPLEISKSPPKWVAAFKVDGTPGGHEDIVAGVDALQALMSAIQGLRIFLEASGEKFSWFSWEVGDTGIPRSLPVSYGLKFSRALEALVQAETTKHVEENLRRRKGKGEKDATSVRRRAAAKRRPNAR